MHYKPHIAVAPAIYFYRTCDKMGRHLRKTAVKPAKNSPIGQIKWAVPTEVEEPPFVELSITPNLEFHAYGHHTLEKVTIKFCGMQVHIIKRIEISILRTIEQSSIDVERIATVA